MVHKLKYSIFLFLVVFACTKSEKTKTNLFSLIIEVGNPNDSLTYTLDVFHGYLAAKPFKKFKLDQNGSYAVKININKPLMLSVSGDFFKRIYAVPGESIQIRFNTVTGEFDYGGSLANYMKATEEIYRLDKRFMDNADLDQFISVPRLLEDSLDQLLINKLNVLSTYELSSTALDMIRAQTVAYHNLNMSGYKKYYNENRKKGLASIKEKRDDSAYDLLKKFSNSANASQDHLYEIFSKLMVRFAEGEGFEGNLEWRFHGENWSKFYYWLDKNENIGPPYKSSLKAYAVLNSVLRGDVESAWNLRDEFIFDHSEEVIYVRAIRAMFEELSHLRQGLPAPNFSYKDPTGKEVSLTDFKGKVVYLQLWYTRCPPCIRELPNTKRLYQEYADKEDVAFVAVSLDRQEDHQRWLNFIAVHTTADVHLFGGNGIDTEIMNQYVLGRVPSFVLIDKRGLIHLSRAPWPMNREHIIEEIESLRN